MELGKRYKSNSGLLLPFLCVRTCTPCAPAARARVRTLVRVPWRHDFAEEFMRTNFLGTRFEIAQNLDFALIGLADVL